MLAEEIRHRFIDFFVERGHLERPGSSLVPPSYDASVLFTTAGMQQFKPYFRGEEAPPRNRLVTIQKCFRTTDIARVGRTRRHVTFFEMLGNFSIGDYFKREATEYAMELSTKGYGLDPNRIWATVFGGDAELGLGPDEEAIEYWRALGVPDERIVRLGIEDNFWQAGPTGPCGPCSELYYDRGPDFGGVDDRPGDDSDRHLEYWNLVFMQYELGADGRLTPLPQPNIDTGLGLDRLAAILQDAPSVYDTAHFEPIQRVIRGLSPSASGDAPAIIRGRRILADHARALTFLIADGVVPSNEDRGYTLRRLIRRAIHEGTRLKVPAGFLGSVVDAVIEAMGAQYPELVARRDDVMRWVAAEERSFGRALEQGMRLLDDHLAAGTLDEAAAFELHDTYGFPFEMTQEIGGERGFTIDVEPFQRLMDEQRARSRAAAGAADRKDGKLAEQIVALTRDAVAPTTFTGYETLEQHTAVDALQTAGGRTLVKLSESPFYATGGGQIADTGVIECENGGCRARVLDVLRLGDDQAIVVEALDGDLRVGERVVCQVAGDRRHATQCHHTATHLLHAALRERLGSHVHQAGSYVGPDKLRFDFTHGSPLTDEDVRWVEDRVNELVLANRPVRALTMTLEDARDLGAMALFGEKYGDVVRVVEVGDGSFSRELCGGTHVRSTAEIGLVKIVSQTSSASNVRRIEALAGPEAVATVRRDDELLRETARLLRKPVEDVPAAVAALQEQTKAAQKAATGPQLDILALANDATAVGDANMLTATLPPMDPKALPDIADRLKGQLGNSAVVLATAVDGRVSLVASVTPALVETGIRADDLVKLAAAIVGGGGGGGRPTMAQAGGKDPSRIDEALEAVRDAIRTALSG